MRSIRRIAIIVMLLAGIAPLYAGYNVYLRAGALATYTTNVFSSPLPHSPSSDLLKRFDAGSYADADLFFADDGRTGLSLSFLYSFPFKAESIDKSTSQAYDSTDEQESAFFLSIGPIFRAQIGKADFGAAIRLSIGSYSHFSSSFNLSLQIEPYVMYPIAGDSFFINAGMLYTAHFYDFLLEDEKNFYSRDFFMLSAGAYVGFSYKWSI